MIQLSITNLKHSANTKYNHPAKIQPNNLSTENKEGKSLLFVFHCKHPFLISACMHAVLRDF